MGLNFRVVENLPLIPEELIEPFKKDYLNGLRYKELSKKYDMSEPKVRKVIDKLELPLRKGGKRNPRYYHFNQDDKKYHVAKCVNKHQLCNISFDTEEAAKEAAQYLVKHDWSEESIKKVRAKKKHKKYKYYHYNKQWGKYIVSKRLNGEQLFISAFDNECEAQEVVKYLKSNDWSTEALHNVMKKKVR